MNVVIEVTHVWIIQAPILRTMRLRQHILERAVKEKILSSRKYV